MHIVWTFFLNWIRPVDTTCLHIIVIFRLRSHGSNNENDRMSVKTHIWKNRI